jgi:hypothetical protein
MTKDLDLSRQWNCMCRDVESVHAAVAEFLDQRFKRIFDRETARFLGLGEPATEQELQLRRMQRAVLSGKIAALSQAGSLARFDPNVSAAIASEVEQLAEQPLPEGEEQLPEFHRGLVAFCDRLSAIATAHAH